MSERLDAARDKLDVLTARWIGAATRGDEAERVAIVPLLAFAAEEYLVALLDDDDDDEVPVYLLDEPNVDRPPREDP